MTEEFDPQVLMMLAPIFSLAGGKDMIHGQYGELIMSEYLVAVSGFSYEIACEGIRIACRGETFKPSPYKVKEVCEMVLEDVAKRFLNASAREAINAMDEVPKRSIAAAHPRDQNEMRQRHWAKHFGVDWDAFYAKRFGTTLDKVRLLPRWKQIEPDCGVPPSEVNAMVDAMFSTGKTMIESVKNSENTFGRRLSDR